MKRWIPAFVVALLACIPVLLRHATDPSLLLDTDTSVLLRAIRARQSPLSWFLGDWPLQNHFYRPVATLTFEIDNRLYGSNAAGYGWTNDLLCVACILLLFWFVRELTNRPIMAGAAAVLFASWHVNPLTWVEPTLGILFWILLAIGGYRHRKNWRVYAAPALALLFLATEIYGVHNLSAKMINWLPGRTASTMSVFALISLAAYARYERLGASTPRTPDPNPLTPPATRNSQATADIRPRAPLVWIFVSLIALVLSMASYEQGVMVPAALLGVACCFALQKFKPHWKWQTAFWGLFVGYAVLRHALVPSNPSHYQLQQFRRGPGVFIDLARYTLPIAGAVPALIASFDLSLGAAALVLNPMMYSFISMALETAAAIVVVLRRYWVLALTGWALSIVTFLPMAFLKPFEHYDYLPMAMRSVFVVALCMAIWDAALIAVRPPALQAPPRPSPAPGSLPSR